MLGAAGPVMPGIAGLRGVERQRGAGAGALVKSSLPPSASARSASPDPRRWSAPPPPSRIEGSSALGARLDDDVRRGSVAVLGDIGAEDVKRRGEASPTAIPAPARASGPTNSGSATASAAPAARRHPKGEARQRVDRVSMRDTRISGSRGRPTLVNGIALGAIDHLAYDRLEDRAVRLMATAGDIEAVKLGNAWWLDRHALAR